MKNAFVEEQATKDALADFIKTSSRFSMGPECKKFEQAFAQKQECKHAILFNSGGSANLAILQAYKNLGRLKEGNKVGYSALTWSTNTMPIIQLGMEAIPVDIEATKLNVTASKLEERLAEEPLDAFFATNVLGLAGDLEKIKSLCEERGVLFIEDNCESLGSRLPNGTLTGNFGEAASFSFFIAHHMSTIEGGMVCTDNDDVAEMLRIVRANGWDRDLTPDQQQKWRSQNAIDSEFQSKYTFYDLGFNLRPTEITGFLGQKQLGYLEGTIQNREKNFGRIQQVVAQNDDFIPLDYQAMQRVSAFAFPYILKSAELKTTYVKRFQEAEIEIRPMIAGNMQRQPFYAKYNARTYDLPDTDLAHFNGFYSGNYPELSEEELNIIISCLQK